MTRSFQNLAGADRRAFVSKFPDASVWRTTAPEVMLQTAPPRVLAGAATSEEALQSFGPRPLRAEESGVLTAKGAYVYDLGLVIKDDTILLDKAVTVAPQRLGAWGHYTHVLKTTDQQFEIPNCLLREEKLGRAVVLVRCGDSVHGHWLLEVMPRASAAMKILGNDAVFIIAAHTPEYQVEMLEALGIPRNRLYRLGSHEAVWCDEVWVPSVAHTSEMWIHPFVNETYDFLIRHVGSDPDAVPREDARIFVTRGSRERDPRPLLNVSELEGIAHQHGYHIIDPGRAHWRDQIRFFAQASRVVGLNGSGLHNTVFTGRAAHVCVLQPNQNLNFLQTSIAAIRGHAMSYLIGETFSAFDRHEWHAGYIIDPTLFRLFLQRIL